MRTNLFCSLTLGATLLMTCCKTEHNEPATHAVEYQQFQKLSDALTVAETHDSLSTFLSYYDTAAIVMAEYQPTITGITEIESFYKEIFKRQKIKTLKREAADFIDLGKTIVEIGTFTKEYTNEKSDSLWTQSGKYWHVWNEQPNGTFKLTGEAFGFFHHVKHPEELAISFHPEAGDFLDEHIPFELKAYNALNEKYVRMKVGAQRAGFYTDDGQFMPFADSTVTGMDDIKSYLIDYSAGPNVTIDPVSVWTFKSDYFNDRQDILEYYKFKAEWHSPPAHGKAEGKGIRIWKRQKDGSLRIYREIGTHNHLQ